MRRRLEVLWSEESKLRTDEIIEYLLHRWTQKEALNFLNALKKFENIVSQFPAIYPESE